jgi:hypothetical protein
VFQKAEHKTMHSPFTSQSTLLVCLIASLFLAVVHFLEREVGALQEDPTIEGVWFIVQQHFAYCPSLERMSQKLTDLQVIGFTSESTDKPHAC